MKRLRRRRGMKLYLCPEADPHKLKAVRHTHPKGSVEYRSPSHVKGEWSKEVVEGGPEGVNIMEMSGLSEIGG
jgi:hypothetical protein